MRGIVVLARLTVGAAALVFATACSVADYQKPISDFAAATQDAETALVALDAEVTEAYAIRLRAQVDAGAKLVQVQAGECELTSARCRLEAISTGGQSEVIPPEPLLGQMVIIMGAIRTYADGLTAIVNADTAEQVATHVNATLGSVGNFASTLEKLGVAGAAAPVKEYKTSVGKAVNWLVGQYVAKVQVDGLREATGRAQPVIARSAEIFESTALFAADITNDDLTKKFDAARVTYENDSNQGNLTNLIQKAADYDRVLQAAPSSVYAGLRQAHEALTKNLHNEDLSMVDVLARIEAFGAEAKALVQIVKEIAAVNEE